MKGKTLIFALTFIICGGTSSSPTTTQQETTTTTQQETTTTTQQETTTTTQQETTTTTHTVNVDPIKFCEENPDNPQCQGFDAAKFCEENPDNPQCQGFDQANQGSGGMGSGGMGSGGSPANDDPPFLYNLLITNWGPYEPSTGVSGDFEFKSELQLVFFDEFGRVHSAGTPGAYDNPTFEYKVPRDTLVHIPINGVIDFFQFQPTSSYVQDDWELMIKPARNSDWAVVIDHVVSLSCDRTSRAVCQNPLTVNGEEIYSGMQVQAGDVIGYVGNYEDGEGGSVFGRTEISIGKYVRVGNQQQDFNNFCPTNYLHPSVKDSIHNSVNQIMASYESWSGNSNFYDESNMVAPGCWYSEIYESNGQTTPKK
ncbi:hypothetical protein OAZ29_00510 [Acidimicrobiaceae bacterium]|jgi:hypothetical protein|nr:hypothetical protein [Acidimicrobiaceae bacterium]